MFTKEDFVQMEEHGLTPAALETQLKNFREGFPFLPVTRAASCGDGIRGWMLPGSSRRRPVTTVRRSLCGW